jgi:hypothetical protein
VGSNGHWTTRDHNHHRAHDDHDHGNDHKHNTELVDHHHKWFCVVDHDNDTLRDDIVDHIPWCDDYHSNVDDNVRIARRNDTRRSR